MTHTTTLNAASPSGEAPAAGTAAARDVFQQLYDLAWESRGASAYYRAVLTLLAGHFRAWHATLDLCHATGTLAETFVVGESGGETWQRLAREAMLESQSGRVALARLYHLDGADRRLAMLVVPLRDEQQHRGAVCLTVNYSDRKSAETRLFELRALTSLAGSLASAIGAARQQSESAGGAVTKALARAAKYGSVTELAFAITNGLKTKFECDQVVLGQVLRGRVQLLSLSGLDGLYPRSPGVRLIRQAMEECLDAGEIICSAPGTDWSATRGRLDYRLHRQWRAAVGDAAVASLPLRVQEECVAVLSLARSSQAGFRAEELHQIEQMVGAYAPALQLVARASRGWFAQTRDTVRDAVVWLLKRNCWGRRFTAVSVVALVIWFCAGTWDYRLSNPCQLTPAHVRHCVAPYNGTIAAAYVQAGDQVRAGEVLFALDTRDLELELAEFEAESAVLELETAQTLAQGEFQAAALTQARLQVVRSKIEGARSRIELATCRAPQDGVVLVGDLTRRVGETVELGESLLEFAPHGTWAVEVQIHSRDAQLVRAGQTGRFATLAQPDRDLPCRVRRVEPASVVVGGKTVFVAHAEVIGHATDARAGMEGVATLEVGRRPVWWVVLHRAIDFVRLRFWV